MSSLSERGLENIQNSSFAPKAVATPDANKKVIAPQSSAAVVLTQNGQDINDAPLNRSAAPAIPSVVAADEALTQATSAIVSDLDIAQVANFEPSILDSYDNVTYNFKLALASDAEIFSSSLPKSLYVIAQSGTTANFFIKDVEISSIVSANAKTTNTFATNIRFSVVEPQGVSLIDRMMQAAKTLNIKNLRACPMVLELTFRGYNSSTGLPAQVTIAKKYWKIVVTNVTTNLQDGGSEYAFECVSNDDHSFNRMSGAANIKEVINIRTQTIGAFFDELGNVLTAQGQRLAANNQIARDKYVFKVEDSLRSWSIGESKDQKNVGSMQVNNNGDATATFDTTASIQSIVDVVFASTKEGQLLVNPNSDPNKMNNDVITPKIPQIIHVTGRVDYGAYNAQSNDYDKTYTYYISKFAVPRALIEKPSQSDTNRLQYLIQNSLKKKYSYIFTGQNTDVINLDINLNYFWTHATTYYASAFHTQNNSTNSNFNQKAPVVSTPDDLRVSLAAYAYSPAPQQVDNASSIPDSTVGSAPAPLAPAQRTSPVTQSQLRASSDLSYILENMPTGSTTAINLPIEGSQDFLDIPQSESRLVTTNADGDVLIEAANAQNTQDPLLSFFTKSADPKMDVSNVNQNVEGTSASGKTAFGVVTQNLYNTGESGDLLQIILEIKGDPYWLGENLDQLYARLESDQPSQPEGKFANFLQSEKSLLLTFKTPVDYSETTGFVNLSRSDIYTGVYTVVSVSSSFSGGKFVQKIEAVRDLQTNPQDIAQYIR